MSINLGSLPPPFPNAASSLSKIASNAQLRQAVEEASENKPIQTGVSSEEVVKTIGSSGVSNTSGSEDNTQSQDTGSKLDLSV
jgi:hypothetical protein